MEWHHGGDWAGFQRQYGCSPMDFSANVSPLGLPEGVREAVRQTLDHCERYPDPFCRDLVRSIGQTIDVPEEWILCGNGAGDLIYRVILARRPRTALVTAPTFSEYANALRSVDCRILEYHLLPEKGFRISQDMISVITGDLDMIVLCEPNNPTGVTTDPHLLRKILRRCEDCNVLLVVDECFNGFLDYPKEHSLLTQGKGSSQLLVLNAFTKSYGMAGLRLGYAVCSDRTILEGMLRSGPPWPVSAPAQAAGVAALKDKTYPLRLRELLSVQRPYLKRELARCGARDIQGEANYLFFSHPDSALADKLKERNILIRTCSDYSGLGKGWYRTAIRTAEDNRTLIREMHRVVNL